MKICPSPFRVCVVSAGSSADWGEGFLVATTMRTVKIVNHSIEDASETELIVRGATIAINRNSKGKEHYLSFDLCHEEDVDWIINALSAVSRCLKNQHLSPSDTKSQFAKMRQMLAESGGDGL